MASRSRIAGLVAAVASAASLAPGVVAADAGGRANGRYEVWAIDQSNSPGRTYGGTLYVWDGEKLANGSSADAPETVDLGGPAAAACLAATGANPVRPHMVAFNAEHTHAVVSFVASGHVLLLDAATREARACVRTSAGAGGARQAHFAAPSPDGAYVVVANQNGKRLERVDVDYAANTFALNPAATIDLASCTTPNGAACQDAALRPDNAPICPVVEATSRHTFVTLRGGGMFVVDSAATPMRIVAEYDRATVHPNGCGGAEVPAGRHGPGKMYVNSGGGTGPNLFEADLYAFPVTGFSAANPPNTPAPSVVLSEDVAGADAHGVVLTKHGRELWMADRGRNLLWVVDTATDQLVDRLPLAGDVSADPTPDILAVAPPGNHVFASLRGPNPLTADPHVSTGSTPGVGVLRVVKGGHRAQFELLARVSNVDAGGVERADVHALAVRSTG